MNFARNGPFLGQKEVFGELLRQCRTALHHAAARCITNQGAQNSLRIDSQMRIKAAILDCDKGFWQIGRQVRDPDRGASGVAAIGEQNSRFIENGNVRRPFRHGKRVDRRQFRRLIGNHARARNAGPDSCDHAPIQQQGDRRAAFPGHPRSSSTARHACVNPFFGSGWFPGGWPTAGSRRTAVLRFVMPIAPPYPKIDRHRVPGRYCAAEVARFYDKSGGLRAGKGLAAQRKIHACPCKSGGGFIAAACDLAKAAPKSAPVPGAAKGRA